MKQSLEDKFFDINKFPKEPGLIVFPISMSRIENAQNGKKYFDWMKHFEKKAVRANAGTVFVYTDSLYQKYNQESKKRAVKYFDQMLEHKNSYLNEVQKGFYVEKAVSFFVWHQVCVNVKRFNELYHKLLSIYDDDDLFQRLVHEDLKSVGKEIKKENELFVLEELLVGYLIRKGQVYLPNEFVQNSQKWILMCYPGKPIKSFVYFSKQNFFKLDNPDNPYQDCEYDLAAKKLYDHLRMKLD